MHAVKVLRAARGAPPDASLGRVPDPPGAPRPVNAGGDGSDTAKRSAHRRARLLHRAAAASACLRRHVLSISDRKVVTRLTPELSYTVQRPSRTHSTECRCG